MRTLRQFFRDRPALAALLLAAALCLKIVLPAGYMPSAAGSDMVVALCSSMAPEGQTVTIRIPGKAGQDDMSGSAKQSCAFAPLAAAVLGSVPPAIVLAALLFVFVAAILGQPLALRPVTARIRPPSQGPPAFA
ncbi:hypothetical protein [Novosphingobium endophyticum]|uniref:hypothetical protein n=1 Tax=Novosphingobium endophyticum TaxID=1955250 RepID=UPI001663845F|nr:hypothetical protein [Novosphingobium endophyticum]